MPPKKEDAVVPEPVVMPDPARVEFFSDGNGRFGYQRCARDGWVLGYSEQRYDEVAEAIQAAYEDPANAGLQIQDPSFVHRPVAGW